MMSTDTSSQVVVVTGAGSGVGRAVALKFAAEGWSVALLGRRMEALQQTIAQAGPQRRKAMDAFGCDLGDAAGIARMAAAVIARFEHVDVLVNAAGNNVAKRSLLELSREDYGDVMAANVNGVLFTVQAFLPHLRRRGAATVVNVGSEAGRQASAKSGAAYVVSKFGLTGLTQTINAEERANGIRACCVFPGDIDTPLLEKRPVPPTREARARMLQPGDVAACVWLAATLPARAAVEEIVIRPARPLA